jgi:hypothetical protein
MKWLGQLALTLAVFSSGVGAGQARAGGFVHPACEQAHLAVFAVDQPPRFSQDINLCADRAMLPEHVAFVRYIGGLNEKAAAYLGVPTARLFKTPIAVLASVNVMGPLTSRGGPGVIVLGVFSDWKGSPVSQGVYFHELGHVLAAAVGSEVLPAALHDLSDSALMVEGFADMLSLGIAGTVFSEEAEPLGCARKARVITQYQSYDFARDYFAQEFGLRRLVACCKKQIADGTLEARFEEFCGEVMPIASQLSDLDRRTPFDAQELLARPEAFDSHQLGIPLNSYYRALSTRLGLPTVDLIMGSLWAVSRTGGTDYDCQTAAGTKRVAVSSLADVLLTARARAAGVDRAASDEIWAKHGMDKALTIARAQAVASAEALAGAGARCQVR